MLRITRVGAVGEAEKKNLLPQASLLSDRHVNSGKKKKGEITNYNQIYIQNVTKERN